MEENNIKKVNIVSTGDFHVFKNVETGELVYKPCTRKNYEKLTKLDGKKHNPKDKDNLIWVYSVTDTPVFDTPNGQLSTGDYYESELGVHILKTENGLKVINI